MRHHHSDDEPVVVIEKHGGSVGSFLLGLGVGAAVALLVAPQSGEATRRLVARRARTAGDAARGRARSIADDVSDEVGGRLDRAREAVTTRVDRARGAVELKRQQVQRAVEAGRVAAQQAREDLERRIVETKAAYQAGADVARDRGPGAAVRSRPGVAPTGYEEAPAGAEDGDADLRA